MLRHELGSDCRGSEHAFFAMRRAIARGKATWRATSVNGAEILLGPPRSSTEAGGALGRLDAALEARDCREIDDAHDSLTRALGLLDVELGAGLPPRGVARAVSDMAYELGLVFAGASQEQALSAAGEHADALGLLDGVRALTSVFEGARAAPLAARWRAIASDLERAVEASRVDEARDTAPKLGDRALLVRRSGELGVALRESLRSAGHDVPAPYVPHRAVPAAIGVHALIVPRPRVDVDAARVALGRRLFTDVRLSVDRRRSCASCHDPRRAFTDGRRVPISLIPSEPLTRNTPTLLYAALGASFLWDGRVATAASQAERVIHSKAELGLTAGELEARLGADPALVADFTAAFPDGFTAQNLGRALSAYQASELAPATSPLDRFARGEDAVLDAKLARGFDVFAGAGRCGRCHVPPLFAGARPTDFATAIYSVLGVPERPGARRIDPDRGRANVTENDRDAHAFKTPTLRNVGRTAPYFHHGAFGSLASVLDFYVKGGGRGAGLSVDHQDPDVRPLVLNGDEQAALLDFMRRGLADR